ncbi:hypothetical protein L7F22_064366 [Adiantum nelumboides]|nr:hypothetical protein [Adiantum nelumboides]
MPYLPSMNENEDDDDLLLEACQKDLQAVKEACRTFADDDSDVDEEPACLVDDDDDVLLLSIQKRFGASRLAEQPPLSPSFAEEDDEEILRVVQERFATPLCKKTNAVKVHKAIEKGAKTFKDFCSLEESTTNLHQKATALEAQAISDCNVSSSSDQIPEQREFWPPEQAGDTAGGCHVSLLPAQASHVSSSPIETPVENLSPVQTPEQTRFRLPGQVEVFHDNFEGLSDDERVDGFAFGDDLPRNLLEDYHKQSIRCTLDALKKNRLSQRVLTHKLGLLKLKMDENRDLKKRVKALLDFQNVTKRKYAFEEEYLVSDNDNTKRHRISGWPRVQEAEVKFHCG